MEPISYIIIRIWILFSLYKNSTQEKYIYIMYLWFYHVVSTDPQGNHERSDKGCR
jgi:hypothetical protein